MARRKIGDWVKIIRPKSKGFYPFDAVFDGNEGRIIGIEGTNPIMYRIKLYFPVTLPDGTVVRDDLWASEYLRKVG